ncbi:sensor histidine kinase [Paenibacillus sp. WLX2291]|uniref:sensor histidine kinase n=1 Tax=Paenibacillus sp. WLX2291 TaxID=3296934 RepID=UPI0039840585
MQNSHHFSGIAREARKITVLWIFIIQIGVSIIVTVARQSAVHVGILMLLLFAFMVMNWFFDRFSQKWVWLYFTVQVLLSVSTIYFSHYGYALVQLGLYPLLAGQFLYAYYDKVKMFFFMALGYAIVLWYTLTTDGVAGLALSLSLVTVMNIIVISIVNLMLRQYYARVRTQNFLEELEKAHRQVEELTVANERQRMARDLHDTLAQGLVGIIMQLEAVHVHLGKDNTSRAREIVSSSMDNARTTLAEAREVIDNLRLQSTDDTDFGHLLQNEVNRFQAATGIAMHTELTIPQELSPLQMEHSLHIVRECLTNIARHAEAHYAALWLGLQDEHMLIRVVDDGRGLDTSQIGKQPGHYGLLGIRERVRIMYGNLNIMPNKPKGTIIEIEIPLR